MQENYITMKDSLKKFDKDSFWKNNRNNLESVEIEKKWKPKSWRTADRNEGLTKYYLID